MVGLMDIFRTQDGCTALMTVVQGDHEDETRLLLTSGADKELKDKVKYFLICTG